MGEKAGHDEAPVIGIGILAYHDLEDVALCLDGVERYSALPLIISVWDNSENWRIGEWLLSNRPWVRLFKSPDNQGCARPRNRMIEDFHALGVGHAIILDQDVRPTAHAWDADMLEVFLRYPDTGIVGWALIARQMCGRRSPGPTGELPELPGACNMYSIEALMEGPPERRGWCEEYFAYRFDSDVCFVLAAKGYKARLVNPNGEADKIAHDHPHSGVLRNRRYRAIQRVSDRILDKRRKAGIFSS